MTNHPGSIDVVKGNRIERELQGSTASYVEERTVFGERYVRIDFADDLMENQQRMQKNFLFCWVMHFFFDRSDKSMGEVFGTHDHAELEVEKLKKFYEENK